MKDMKRIRFDMDGSYISVRFRWSRVNYKTGREKLSAGSAGIYPNENLTEWGCGPSGFPAAIPYRGPQGLSLLPILSPC